MPTQINTENAQTGANSANQNTTAVSSTVTQNLTNESAVTNTFNLTANTGNNVTNANTKVGDVGTGEIELAMDVSSIQNDNTSAGLASVSTTSVSDDVVTVTSSNVGTGSGSTNRNTQTVTNTSTVNQVNSSTTTNAFTANLNTGGNTTNGNTEIGDVTTGSIRVLINVKTTSNSPDETPDGPGPSSGPCTACGGGDLPPTVIPSLTKKDLTPPLVLSQPKDAYTGQGGGYFAAGNNMMGLEVVALVVLSVILVQAGSKLRQALSSFSSRFGLVARS